MKETVRDNPWISVVLGIITLGVLYFLNDHTILSNTPHKRPQEYMKGIVMHDFTEQGSLKQSLQAKTWAYRPEVQRSTLEKPVLKIYKPTSLWIIQSDEALVKQPTLGSIETVTLKHHVQLERPPTQEETALRLETELLHYEPRTETAHSDQWVIIKRPDFQISGIGLEASFHPETLNLLKDVQTTYTLKPS